MSHRFRIPIVEVVWQVFKIKGIIIAPLEVRAAVNAPLFSAFVARAVAGCLQFHDIDRTCGVEPPANCVVVDGEKRALGWKRATQSMEELPQIRACLGPARLAPENKGKAFAGLSGAPV